MNIKILVNKFIICLAIISLAICSNINLAVNNINEEAINNTVNEVNNVNSSSNENNVVNNNVLMENNNNNNNTLTENSTNSNQTNNNQVNSNNQTENRTNYNNRTNYETREPEKSSNADLSNIYLDGLDPTFEKNITDYYVTIESDIESIEFEAIPDDEKSEVTIEGNENLEYGENLIEIKVKAENGNTKTYSIYVTKINIEEFSNANLKELSIENYNFYPSFKYDIYNYNIIIDEETKELNILAESEIEDCEIEIIGNKNLTNGDNLIKIIVTAKDGETKKEYKINAYVKEKPVEIQETNRNEAYIIIIILSVLIIITGIIVIKKRKNN